MSKTFALEVRLVEWDKNSAAFVPVQTDAPEDSTGIVAIGYSPALTVKIKDDIIAIVETAWPDECDPWETL